MGEMIIWLILALLVLFAVIAIIFAKKGKERTTDYYTLFVMGIIWLPFGIIIRLTNDDLFLGNLFIMLGLAYSVLGLTHRKEWKKNHKSWKRLSNKKKKTKILVSIGLGILVLIGLVAFYLVE